MGKTTKKWLSIVLGVLLAVLLALGLCWDQVKVYLAPKTVLREALEQTLEDLEDRFSGSPVRVLAQALDESGCNTVSVQMDKPHELLGQLHYDMTLHTRMMPKQILGEGSITGRNTQLLLSLYLDQDFAAIASERVGNGQYYGITYDTFSQDIRSNPILAFLLGEDTISQWEESVAGLQQSMSGGIGLPEISEDDLELAMVGLLALKADVSREAVELQRGVEDCFRIGFSLPGALLLEAVEYAGTALPVNVTAESELSVAFFLAQDRVASLEFQLTGPESLWLCVMPDMHPKTDSISIQVSHQSETEKNDVALTVDTIFSDSLYTEEIWVRTEGEQAKEFSLRYSWNRETGEGQISRTENEASISAAVNLRETEEGFCLETPDLDALLAILGEGEDTQDTPAVVTVSEGTPFAAPAYRNLDQWSMEDLMALLGGVGSLLGLGL